MLTYGQRLKRLLLVLGDFAVFELALILTLLIRYGSITDHDWQLHAWPFTILFFLWLMVFYVANLYDLNLFRQSLKLFRSYLEAMIANLAVAVGFFYLIPIFNIAPRTNLFLHFVISLLLGYFWRLIFHRCILERIGRGRVLFIGPAQDAPLVYELLRASSLGLDLVAAIATQGERPPLPILWLSGFERFERLLQEQAIQTVVLGTRPDDLVELKTTLYQSLFTPIHLLDRAELEEATTGRIPLSYVSETWFLHHLRESEKTWFESFKRGMDILLGIPFGLLTLMTFPLVALAIKLSSSGPILFTQIRVGKGGKTIRIWKYRTMRLDAEKDGPKFTASTATDPRITNIGRLMRQLRIDELPQIWNVLRGDLSFVGPRPERPEFVTPLLERMPYYGLRHLTRPGLTGWAQVKFLTPTSNLEDNLKKLQYDLYYIKRRSILLDVAILLKTIGIVLRRQGT